MAQEELFQLVHSLSPSELRYVRVQSQRHSKGGTPKYMVLLDALLQMDSYSQEALERHCAGENFLKQLPSARRYLMEQLLRALRDYHSGASVEGEIRTLLDDIELLHQRGLKNHCRRQLKQATKLARELDLPLLLIECLRWERRLLKGDKPPDLQARIEAVEREEAIAVRKIDREGIFLSYHDRALLKLETDPKPDPADEEDSFYGRLAYLTGMGVEALTVGDGPSAYEAFRELYDFWRAHPEQIENYPLRFRSSLTNYTGAILQLDRVEDLRRTMEELQKLKGISESLQRGIQPYFIHHEMLYMLNVGRWEEVKPLAESLERDLEQQKEWDSYAITYRYNLAVAWFLLGDYRSSLRLFQSLQVKEVWRLQQPFYTRARIWELMLHIYMDNGSVLPYLGRSLRRFFKKAEDWGSLGKAIVEAALRWAKADRRERTGLIEVIGLAIEEIEFRGKEDMRRWVRRMLEEKLGR